MKKGFVAILVAVLLATLCACALADGTFRVGMECNYAPFNWTQATASEHTVQIEGGAGYADGYDVQIARLIAESMGKELVIVKTEWSGLAMGVQSGAFDAIIAGMSPTAERQITLDFSAPYYSSELVVVVRKAGAYASAAALSDLTGATITGQLGTVHYDFIDQIPGVNKMTAMETFPAMIVALQSGAIDGYIAERPGAEADTSANPDLMYLSFADGAGFLTTPEQVAIAVGLPKGSALTDEINSILAGIDEETRVQLMMDATARQPLSNP